jgi:hypothetical protein
VGAVSDLMSNGDDDRHRPVDNLEHGHEGEPHVPGDARICMLVVRRGARADTSFAPRRLRSPIGVLPLLIRHFHSPCTWPRNRWHRLLVAQRQTSRRAFRSMPPTAALRQFARQRVRRVRCELDRAAGRPYGTKHIGRLRVHRHLVAHAEETGELRRNHSARATVAATARTAKP